MHRFIGVWVNGFVALGFKISRRAPGHPEGACWDLKAHVRFTGSWVHGLMGAWAHRCMGSWFHKFMGYGFKAHGCRGLIGSWFRGFMVHGCMGSWAHGFTSSWVRGFKIWGPESSTIKTTVLSTRFLKSERIIIRTHTPSRNTFILQ